MDYLIKHKWSEDKSSDHSFKTEHYFKLSNYFISFILRNKNIFIIKRIQ